MEHNHEQPNQPFVEPVTQPAHNHGIDQNVGTPQERAKRFGWSAALRLGSAALLAWGGASAGNSALVVEAAEELADAAAFAGASREALTKQRGLSQRWRNGTLGAAAVAASVASFEVSKEVITEFGDWRERMAGIDLSNNAQRAALGAVALNSVVLAINRRGKNSPKASDRYAFQDSLRDFMIPGGVLVLAAGKFPQAAELLLESGGVAYGWYNVVQLWRGWRSKPSQKPAH